EAVAIAARLLRPAAKGLATGPAFGAAVPGDLHGDEAQRAGIGAAALPEVAVPAGPAIAGDAHPLERPVPRATDMEAAHGQAVHVEVADPHVAGVARVHARAGPVAEGRRLARAGGDLALAAAGMAVVLDAGGVVGDLEAGELHMVDPAQVDDAGGALAAPQLRRIVAGAVVAAAEDAGRPRRGSGWQRRHVAVPGEVARAALGARRSHAHAVAAGADAQGVAAGDARLATRRQREERVRPGAVPGRGAARRIPAAVALRRFAAVRP